jgi:sugar lactone lactonase YvrE
LTQRPRTAPWIAAAVAAAVVAGCAARGDDLSRLAAELELARAQPVESAGAAPEAGVGFDLACLLPAAPVAPAATAAAAKPESAALASAPLVPGGLALRLGEVLVSDRRAVYRIDAGSASELVVVEPDAKGDRMPLVLAASPGGLVYAASPDTGRLYRVDVRSGQAQEIASRLARPSALLAPSDGSIVVLESAAGRVTRVDSAGVLQPIASGLSAPLGLGAHAGRLLVGESAGGRVLALRTGSPPVVVASGLVQLAGLTADRSGHVVVAEGRDGTVERVESDASRTTLLSGLALTALAGGRPIPVPLVVDEQGAIFVAAPGDGTVWRVASR